MQFFWPTLIIVVALVVYLLMAWRRNVLLNRELKNQLEEEIKEKQQILSIVSHDIKSPFNRISAFEQLIQMDATELSSDQRNYLVKIHQVVADGLGLIRNLVDYRNLEYRKIEIFVEDIDVSSLVQTTVKKNRSLAEAKNIQFDLDIQEGVHLSSDNHLITRVVDNIISNAIKFSKEGEKIKVSTFQTSSGSVVIEIRDNGPGFSDEEIQKLYRKFQKLSAKSTSGESTTGLGLYNSKNMLQRIGGTIECQSKMREGSKFIITLHPYTQD